jgi:hypothetical protein
MTKRTSLAKKYGVATIGGEPITDRGKSVSSAAEANAPPARARRLKPWDGKPLAPAPIFTVSDVTRMRTLDLTVMCYRRENSRDGDMLLAIPKDTIGTDGKTAILWRDGGDGNYSIDGWEPWHAGMFGGRYEHMASALGWLERARAIRAGTATTF